ncbi:ABC-type cobalamin/Fe3+-siderophores transport system, ATPase component [Gottschalkia purinilytica]|uniref:ABC-type cobalamin/Fe3+-siderophores transport system, ATPase component n=1 Tax=Gottschalkia purinilytica TaxID=1503 RepID=A0A0L0WAY4_GOTPU|nr:ABC transporter ATP-binding protein [Gottschalkia purinilytica]KNF08684.1 ABC-type cobalamin/Fe3+-siderophores transport system, ATPase component [Gottschalkia purinilytica]
MRLEVRNVDCGYDNKSILKDISFEVDTGDIVCILGPNGVGKTTLFKTILGFLKPQNGKITLDGQDVSKWSRKNFAKSIGYVPQAHVPPFPYRVIDVVVMGRTAHLDAFSSPSEKDFKIAEEAIETLNISYLKDSIYTEISGGERQLVLIARALAQEPKILIMDEPTSNLDFGNQIRVLNHIRKLSKRDISVIMTSHFPDHAFIASTKVLVIGRESKFEVGDPKEVITAELLSNIYNIDLKLATVADETNKEELKVCVPIIKD